jgi:hypothetical protein
MRTGEAKCCIPSTQQRNFEAPTQRYGLLVRGLSPVRGVWKNGLLKCDSGVEILRNFFARGLMVQ